MADGRDGDRTSQILGFALCALSGFIVGLLAHQGLVLAGLMATLAVIAGLGGWILRGLAR